MVPAFALLNPIITTFFTIVDAVVGSDNGDSVYVFIESLRVLYNVY